GSGEGGVRFGGIGVLETGVGDNFFSWESRDGIVLTTADWEERFSPPPLPAYLLYQFAAAIVSFGADLPENIPPEHEPAVGCFYDLCRNKARSGAGWCRLACVGPGKACSPGWRCRMKPCAPSMRC